MPTLDPNIVASLAQRRLLAGNQRTQGLQTLGNQYNQNISNLQDYQKDMQQRINDQMGAQGLFNSGIRMNELGKMEKSVGQKRSYFDTQYAQGKSGLEAGYQNAMQAIADEEARQMQEQGRQDLAQQQQAAAQAFQNQQAAQQQANWQADYNLRAQQAAQANQAAAGPSQNDLAVWLAELQRQDDVRRWNEAVWANEIARQNQERIYAGVGNQLGYAGSRMR